MDERQRSLLGGQDRGGAMWLAAATLLTVLRPGGAECFFPFEYHGTYAVQSAPNQYSEVLIEVNSILPYGFCHRKVDDNIILRDGSNGCLRCFHMVIRSVNVLQLHTRDPQTSCATNLNDTYRLCPTKDELSSAAASRRGRVHEIMMYKTKTRKAEPHVAPMYCPISGRFSFSYESEEAVCTDTSSQLSNCPYGFGLHLHFRGCSFQQNLNVTFQCLADWDDGRGGNYLALLDVGAVGTKRPRYRCAMYREEVGSGRIFLSLSSDASCLDRLENATHGHERLVLYSAPSRPWPPAVRRATCTFPDWAQGHWQHAHVNGNTIVYKDVKSFRSYTARCVGGGDEKFVIYSRSHCGEETYNCIWLKKRGVNVMELQLGLSPSPRISNSLCGPHRFLDSGWITQGRQRIVEEASCPVSGEYVGTIPDRGGQLCARLASDCSRPQTMFYTVTSCADSTDVYEGSQPVPSRPVIVPISGGPSRATIPSWQRQNPSGGQPQGNSAWQQQRHLLPASSEVGVSGDRPERPNGWTRQRPGLPASSEVGVSGDRPERPNGWTRQRPGLPASSEVGVSGDRPERPNGWTRQRPGLPASSEVGVSGDRPERPNGWTRQRPGLPASSEVGVSGDRPERPNGWTRQRPGLPASSEVGVSGDRPERPNGWTRQRPGLPASSEVGVSGDRPERPNGWTRQRPGLPASSEVGVSGDRPEQPNGWTRQRPVLPASRQWDGLGLESSSDQRSWKGRRRWRRDAVRYHVSQPRTTRVSYALPSARDNVSSTTAGYPADVYDPWTYRERFGGATDADSRGDAAAPGRGDGPRGDEEEQDRQPDQQRAAEKNWGHRQQHDPSRDQDPKPALEQGRRVDDRRPGQAGGSDSGERSDTVWSQNQDQDQVSAQDRDRNWEARRQPGQNSGRKQNTYRNFQEHGNRDTFWDQDRYRKRAREWDQNKSQSPIQEQKTAEDSELDWGWTPVKDLTPSLNASVSKAKPRQDLRPGSKRRPEQDLRPNYGRRQQWRPTEDRDQPWERGSGQGSFSGGQLPQYPVRPGRRTTRPPRPTHTTQRAALPGFDPTPPPIFIRQDVPGRPTAAPATAPTTKTPLVPSGYREERQYRCLGTWQEGDVMYTYTQRLDALSYECFAGRVMADGRVFIGEAGTDQGCRRRVDPARSGMLISRTVPCQGRSGDGPTKRPVPSLPPSSRHQRPPSEEVARPSPPATSRPRSSDRRPPGSRPPPPTTQRSWRPITARPDRRSSASRRQVPVSALACLVVALLLFLV